MNAEEPTFKVRLPLHDGKNYIYYTLHSYPFPVRPGFVTKVNVDQKWRTVPPQDSYSNLYYAWEIVCKYVEEDPFSIQRNFLVNGRSFPGTLPPTNTARYRYFQATTQKSPNTVQGCTLFRPPPLFRPPEERRNY